MTLALYGKSRKRRGSLLLAALLAVLAATVGGLAVISSAFAHMAEYSTTATCNGDWSASAQYSAGGTGSEGDRRLILIDNVVVNGAISLARGPRAPAASREVGASTALRAPMA